MKDREIKFDFDAASIVKDAGVNLTKKQIASRTAQIIGARKALGESFPDGRSLDKMVDLAVHQVVGDFDADTRKIHRLQGKLKFNEIIKSQNGQ